MCMLRSEGIYDGLQQYKPGEIDKEPQEIQQGYNTEVRQCSYVIVHNAVCIAVGRSIVELVWCTCVLYICVRCHKCIHFLWIITCVLYLPPFYS